MLKAIATVGIIQVLAIIINIIRTKMVAVVLGPEGVGIISIVDQIVQFVAQLSGLSLPIASVKFLSRAHSKGREAFRRSYLGFLKLLLLLTVTGTVITISLVFFRADLLGSDISKYKVFLFIALFSVPVMVSGGFFSSVLASAQHSKSSSILAVITNTVFTIATYAGLTIGAYFIDDRNGNILGMYVSNLLAGIFLSVGIVLYLRKKLSLPIFDRTIRIFNEIKRSPEVLSYSFMMYFAASAYILSMVVVRYSILKHFGEAEVGLLQAAMALALAIGMVLTPTNGLLLFPLVNRHISKVEKIQAAVIFHNNLVIILSVVAMPVILFSHWILLLLYSPEFTAISQFVFLFVIWQCIVQIIGVYQAILIGLDDLKNYAGITCSGHILSGGLCWFLAPHYGIVGIAMGLIFSNMAILLMTFLRLRLSHGFPLLKRQGALLAYSLSVMFFVGLICSRYQDWNIFTALIRMCTYMIFLVSLLLFLTKADRNNVYNLWNRFKHREEAT